MEEDWSVKRRRGASHARWSFLDQQRQANPYGECGMPACLAEILVPRGDVVLGDPDETASSSAETLNWSVWHGMLAPASRKYRSLGFPTRQAP